MTYSLNETEAMGKRAARGAGHHWGIAEEAGKAARWLAARGLPGPDLLAGLLERCDGKDYAELAPEMAGRCWLARSEPLCPLIAGAALSDRAEQVAAEGIELGPVAFPLLLAPGACLAAKAAGSAIRLAWDGATVTVFPDGGLTAAGEPDGLAAPISDKVSCGPAPPDSGPASARRPAQAVSEDTWRRLDAFAQRTYAPATEASRMLGAGAGLSDND